MPAARHRPHGKPFGTLVLTADQAVIDIFQGHFNGISGDLNPLQIRVVVVVPCLLIHVGQRPVCQTRSDHRLIARVDVARFAQIDGDHHAGVVEFPVHLQEGLAHQAHHVTDLDCSWATARR